MSLLDEFLMVFESDGLKELPKESKKAEDALDDLADKAEDAEKSVKKLDKSVAKDIQNIKQLALQATRTIAPFVLLGKAINETMKFASQAIEVAEAAEKAGMTLEQFQLQDGNKYAIYTREDVNNAKDYEMVMRDIRMGTASIGAEISRMILPALTALLKVVRKVVDFFVDHGAFMKAMFIGMAIAITVAAIPAIVNMGIALWTALAPILPIVIAVIAIVTALALVFEDFYKWIHGEPSVAELIFGPFEEFKNKIIKGFTEIKQAFSEGIVNGITVACQKLFSMLSQMFVNFYNEIWQKMPKWLQALLSANPLGLAMNIKTLADSRKPNGSHASGLDYVPFDGYLAELHRGERVQTADEANDWRSGLMAAKNAVNFTANYPLNSIPAGSTSNRTVNISGITIQTQATDAQGIAADLASYIKQAVISLDDGMLA